MRKPSHRLIAPAISVGKQTFQRHPATTAKVSEIRGATAPQSRVEDGAFLADPKPSETELALCRKFWEEKRQFFKQLQSLSPTQRAKFFDQYLTPLPIPPEFQSQDSERPQADHDWSI